MEEIGGHFCILPERLYQTISPPSDRVQPVREVARFVHADFEQIANLLCVARLRAARFCQTPVEQTSA